MYTDFSSGSVPYPGLSIVIINNDQTSSCPMQVLVNAWGWKICWAIEQGLDMFSKPSAPTDELTRPRPETIRKLRVIRCTGHRLLGLTALEETRRLRLALANTPQALTWVSCSPRRVPISSFRLASMSHPVDAKPRKPNQVTAVLPTTVWD